MLAFLKQKFSRVLSLFKKLVPRRKYLFITAGFFVPAFVLFFFFVPDIVHWVSIASIGDSALSSVLSLIVWLIWTMVEITQTLSLFLLEFFLDLASYHNFVEMGIVELGWSMVRDVANMFFVVVLLVIAFATILGIDSYEMKSTLPKLLLMAILINFSKLICGIILDAAHVFTVTFVNAISAAAGGNFVNAFRLDDVWTKTTNAVSERTNTSQTNLVLRNFAASLMALFMMGTAMLAIGAYAIVMLFRVIALWILIILSPIAYIAAVLPKTKSIADEWWNKFIKQTLVAPVMVFFIWLFFATLGQGDIQDQMGVMNGPMSSETVTENAATSFSSLSGFLVAIAFLFGGLQQIGQKFGDVQGGSFVKSAENASRTLGEKASGFRAAKWAGRKGSDLAKKGAKGAAYNAPVVGGKNISRQWKKAKTKGKQKKKQFDQYRDEKLEGVPVGNWLQSSARKDADVDELERKADQEEKIHKAQAKGQARNRGDMYKTSEKEKIQEKEMEDLIKNMTRDEMKAHAIKSATDSNVPPEELKNITSAAIRKDGKTGAKVMDEVANAKGWSEDEVNRRDPKAQLAKFLTSISSVDNIRPDSSDKELKKAVESAKDELGEDVFSDALRNLETKGYNNSKNDGYIGQHGLVESDIDGETGEVTRSLNIDATTEDIRNTQADQAAKINPSQLGGSVWKEFKTEDDGSVDEDAAVNMLSNSGKNTSFRPDFIDELDKLDDLDSIMDNLEKKNKDAYNNISSRLSNYNPGSDDGGSSSNDDGSSDGDSDSSGSSSGNNNPDGSGGGSSSGGSSNSDGGSSSSSIATPSGSFSNNNSSDGNTTNNFNTNVTNNNNVSIRADLGDMQSNFENLQSSLRELRDMQDNDAPQGDIDAVKDAISQHKQKLSRKLNGFENHIDRLEDGGDDITEHKELLEDIKNALNEED